jgi:hypothetical protein
LWNVSERRLIKCWRADLLSNCILSALICNLIKLVGNKRADSVQTSSSWSNIDILVVPSGT